MNPLELKQITKKFGTEFCAAFAQNQLSRKDGLVFEGKTPEGAPFLVERASGRAVILREWPDGDVSVDEVSYGDLAMAVAAINEKK
jgi:hypothetical protein